MNKTINDISFEIVTTILGGQLHGDTIKGIACPACHKKEAWAYKENPSIVYCPRGNNCYQESNLRETHSEIFLQNAISYLQKRGIKTEKFKSKLSWAIAKREEQYFQVVNFKLENGECAGRVIGYSGKSKSHFKQGSNPSSTIFLPMSPDYSQAINLVEGPIDALSLSQQGHQAAAILSSNYKPENNEWIQRELKKFKSVNLAFDNDEAGNKALTNYSNYCESQNIPFSLLIPPKGKDWNDLLIEKFDLNNISLTKPKKIEEVTFNQVPEKKAPQISKKMPPLPPLANKVYENILHNAFVPRENFAFASTLILFSTLAGNQFKFKNNLPNMYIVLVGETGYGKDYPLKYPSQFLFNSDNAELVGAEDYGSGVAMIDGLAKNRVRLDSVDEMSDLFFTINDKKNYINFQKGEILTKLFSASGKFFAGKYNKSDGGFIGRCVSPYLNIIGATTPQGLRGLTEENLKKGLIPRCLFFFEKDRKKGSAKKNITIPNQIIAEIADIREKPSPIERPEDIPELLIDPKVEHLLESYGLQFEKRFIASSVPELMTRQVEYFYKLAGLHHFMMYGEFFLKKPLENISLAWAFEVVNVLWDNLENNISKNIQMSMDIISVKDRVLRYVKKREQVTRKQISNNFREIPRNYRNEIVKDLIEAGELLFEDNIIKLPE